MFGLHPYMCLFAQMNVCRDIIVLYTELQTKNYYI